MDTASEKGSPGNIIPFCIDRRLTVVRGMKQGILFLFIASVFISAYIYRTDLNMNNLERMASYLNLGMSNAGDLSGAMPLDSGISNRFAVIGSGIAVLNRDTLKYLNAAGGEDMEVQLGYSNPAVSASGNLLLCYDRGSNSLCVANTYKVFFEKKMSSPIISAFMGKSGAFCVVTDENDYRAAVTVFDSKQKEIYLWQTSEYFVSSATLSPSGKKMAAAVFSGRGINVTSKVIVYDTAKKDPVCTLSLNEASVLAIHFISEDRITVITNMKTSVYDLSGKLINSVSYDNGSLSGFAFLDDKAALLAFDSGSVDQAIRLSMLDKNGREAEKTTLQGEILSISSAGRNVAVLVTDRAYYLNRELEAVRDPEEARGAKEIYMREDGAAFLIYNNRAALSLPK